MPRLELLVGSPYARIQCVYVDPSATADLTATSKPEAYNQADHSIGTAHRHAVRVILIGQASFEHPSKCLRKGQLQ